jgi:hypothetical protein
MRRIIVFTLLALTLGSGVALADRDHYRRGGVGIRNPNDPVWHQRQHRVDRRPSRVVHRRPVYVNNGYYQFNNGYRYRYARPVIRHRYHDVRVRPQVIVENYQPVAGYVWVAGQWQWNGAEWIWVSGHYAIDPSYNASYDPNYDDDGIRY